VRSPSRVCDEGIKMASRILQPDRIEIHRGWELQ